MHRRVALHQGGKAFPIHHLSPSTFTGIHQSLVQYIYFPKKPAEGHITTLSSPALGTSCTFFKHAAPRGRAKGAEAGTECQRGRCSCAVTACGGHSGLRKEAPVRRPSGLTGTPMGKPRLPSCSGSRSVVCCFVSLHSGVVADRQ